MKNKPNTTYLLARLPIAVSMFGHGLERIPKLQGFSNHMVGQFSKSMLPVSFVTPFSLGLPFLELLTGILLILGLFTRFACILGVLIMLALIFGSSTLEQWENVFTQIIYGAYFTLLYYFAVYNRYSADTLISRS
ncbi:MAG: DoxX [Mucilaginibacter sp.]|nr:DoxX [Mucilaginibacter sp.]